MIMWCAHNVIHNVNGFMWMVGATINDSKKFLDAMDGQVNITVAQSEEYWQRASRSRLAEGEDSCS